MIVKGLRELARELAMSLGKAQGLVNRGVLPSKGANGYDVEAARAALAAAEPSSTAAPRAPEPPSSSGPAPTASASSTATSSPTTPSPTPDEIDPLAIASENLLRAQEFSRGTQGPEFSRSLDTVKKALEEHRRTQVGELAIARATGKAISLDDARATIGRVSRLYISTLSRLEAKLAGQVELWVHDEDLRALEPLARRRRVQEWFGAQVEVFRRLDAAEIEKMIAEETAADG